MRKALLLICLLLAFCGASFAQKLTAKQVKTLNSQITKLQQEINRLNKKLKATKAKAARTAIIDKLDADRAQLAKLKASLAPKPAPAPKPAKHAPTFEAFAEATNEVEELIPVSPEVEAREKFYSRTKNEVGLMGGFFAGATTWLGEVRFNVRKIIGPTTLSVRAATGLALSREQDRRFLPLNLDLIFSFPPGWFSGVENYLGAGLNYLVLTTGSKQGTFGGEAFYGIQSEGFGGMLFGELGYAIMRTGFSPSHKGVTVLVGYRLALF